MHYMDFDPYLAKERHLHIPPPTPRGSRRSGSEFGSGAVAPSTPVRGERVTSGEPGQYSPPGSKRSRNIVNRLTAGGAGGIQIEQSFSARERHGQAIADAVASVYDSKLA